MKYYYDIDCVKSNIAGHLQESFTLYRYDHGKLWSKLDLVGEDNIKASRYLKYQHVLKHICKAYNIHEDTLESLSYLEDLNTTEVYEELVRTESINVYKDYDFFEMEDEDFNYVLCLDLINLAEEVRGNGNCSQIADEIESVLKSHVGDWREIGE